MVGSEIGIRKSMNRVDTVVSEPQIEGGKNFMLRVLKALLPWLARPGNDGVADVSQALKLIRGSSDQINGPITKLMIVPKDRVPPVMLKTSKPLSNTSIANRGLSSERSLRVNSALGPTMADEALHVTPPGDVQVTVCPMSDAWTEPNGMREAESATAKASARCLCRDLVIEKRPAEYRLR